ncbi:DUF2480 family protein [Sinomicrobium weinanense]|uniref:DUF2480 family protein n=1 Tax=Sinomicrobium weinanense TaxID=2842200 RepID=A0A926JNU1_9FLAO|nr:DUF2480 family protein [Sinomicrobium weinanense]MBC9794641.1 DUF2480 family protein [Sinomicrobium weinanense]MBU3124126.1 DUF2480 family protein [Sinomicrobium weinanense]
MAEEIVNRIAQSKLVTIDPGDYYPEGKRILLDIKEWLYEGFILREKDFRQSLKNHDWSRYQDAYVALTCSSDAIIPAWAFMLVTTYLTPVSKKVVAGDMESLETAVYRDALLKVDFSSFKDLPVIVKGCADKPVPRNAYIMLVEHLQKVAKSVMYGEACSSVPLFKR